MALADITLADGQGTPVNHTFAYVSSPSAGRVVRSELARDPDTPLTMSTAHNKVKRGGLEVGSHLQRFDWVEFHADGVTPLPFNARLASDMPVGAYTDARADDIAAFIRNWATSANVRAWLKGSVG